MFAELRAFLDKHQENEQMDGDQTQDVMMNSNQKKQKEDENEETGKNKKRDNGDDMIIETDIITPTGDEDVTTDNRSKNVSKNSDGNENEETEDEMDKEDTPIDNVNRPLKRRK